MSEEMKSAVDERPEPLKGKDFKNNPMIITLEKTSHVWSQDFDFKGKKVSKYGYPLVPAKDGDPEFLFMTQKGMEMIEQADISREIKANEPFTFELRTGTSKAGTPYTIWMINGKSFDDLGNESDDPIPAGGKEETMRESIEKKEHPLKGELSSELSDEQVEELNKVRESLSGGKTSNNDEKRLDIKQIREVADDLHTEYNKYKDMGMDVKAMFNAHVKLLEIIDGIPF